MSVKEKNDKNFHSQRRTVVPAAGSTGLAVCQEEEEASSGIDWDALDVRNYDCYGES